MDSSALVDALLEAAVDGRAFWPGLGSFALWQRKRMPGFPGLQRLQFTCAEEVYLLLNTASRAPIQDQGSTAWVSEEASARSIADDICSEVLARGQASVPGFGRFAIEQRARDETNRHAFLVFHAAPALLQRLNPKPRSYEAALALEWPDGPPEPPPAAEA